MIPARMPAYNCNNCPGYCCSYPLIHLTRRDVARLARHHGLSFEQARAKFTKPAADGKLLMRRKADHHFGKVCRFFDTDARTCTIYAARPAICRQYPGMGRCGYYDFLMFERRAQQDDTWVAVTSNG